MRFSIIVIIILLSSCQKTDQQSRVIVLSDLVGKNWIAYNIAGKDVLKGTKISLSVSESGRINGNSGANHYFGHWKIQETMIKSSKMSSTKRFRMEPQGVMKQEQLYLQKLSEVTQFNILNDRLLLFEDDRKILSFQRIDE